jgi:NDP-sugar pyrophosphorylase family protein
VSNVVSVRPADSLATVFERLRAAGGPGAVVTEEDGTVVGTVTDGAIRRAWMTSGSLDQPVSEIASRRRTMVESDPAPPPVAVLMVGGRGERLRPLTDKVPKPLLRIGGTSIVERIITKLGQAGVRQAWLAVNHMAEQFEAHVGDGHHLGVEVRYLHEDEPLGSAGALTLLPDLPDTTLLVTNGDLVTTVDYAAMVAFHRQHAGAITVAAVEHLTHVPYGVLRTAEHHVLAIDEKPARRDLINAGMYVLEPEVLRLLPVGRFATMPDLVADVVAEGQPVHAFPLIAGFERWIDIGSPEEFERVLHGFATGELE